jgi:hypothetical protein
MRKTYKILVGKPKGKRPLGRARWENKYLSWEAVDCIPLGQARAWCQTGATKGREFLE